MHVFDLSNRDPSLCEIRRLQVFSRTIRGETGHGICMRRLHEACEAPKGGILLNPWDGLSLPLRPYFCIFRPREKNKNPYCLR